MGVRNRHQFEQKNKPGINLLDFVETVAKHDNEETEDGVSRLKKVHLAFREIDEDRNGVITMNELDDIFRLHYPEVLA